MPTIPGYRKPQERKVSTVEEDAELVHEIRYRCGELRTLLMEAQARGLVINGITLQGHLDVYRPL